jgi:hypothetical protein
MNPITKQTIAIIGSSSPIGTSIAKKLCRDNYRLLLFEENCDDARLLSDEITTSVNGADVEFLTCKHLASWEADIIFILEQPDRLDEISYEIKEVSTQKIIAVILEEYDSRDLKRTESHFPNSRIVGITPSESESDSMNLISEDTDARNILQGMLSRAGFQIRKKELIKS